MKSLRRVLVVLSCMTGLLSPCALAHSGEGEEETIRILRDPWGVPHVMGESDYGAMYGFGWALAEDQLENVLSACCPRSVSAWRFMMTPMIR